MNNVELAVSPEYLLRLHEYWQACNYLAAGMIYLRDNPLLQSPLKPEHIKQRLLGHWGSSPGLSFTYLHLSRLVQQHDINAIFIAGPGHGAPGLLGPTYLEGVYSEVYPDKSEDIDGLKSFFKDFSFPGGIGSHCTPELPGSIHEGGELGYSISHAFGAAFDHPDLVVTVMVGDGEAETGPLATAWHSNKFLNPIRDGAVLPILHLNGYKINNPTLLSRISHEELRSLFVGYGWSPVFVEGSEPLEMHAKMAAAMEYCYAEIKRVQSEARTTGIAKRPRWPMVILRSPKGWTGPKMVDGHHVEGFWRAHQVPLANVRENAEHLKQLETWLKGYAPEKLFDAHGRLRADLRALFSKKALRVSANPIANGGILRQPLDLPQLKEVAVQIDNPASEYAFNTKPLGKMLGMIMQKNPDNFRLFGPDETTSNKLDEIYQVSRKVWLADYLPEDADGGELSPEGRVMEMLSEHTLEGWFEGYVLSGRHGFFATYEAFVHVIDSMFNQHAKWLAMSNKVPWRKPVSSINLLLTSTVWRQDHNGFTHQDPGFLDIVFNKSPNVTRVYLPPDANCLLAVSEHCLTSTNYINVIVCDKQKHLQYLDIDQAIEHCQKGLGIWEWASNDDGDPDVIIASAGDVPTKESLAAIKMMRAGIPWLKIRYINVVDLFKLTPSYVHPHGLTDEAFDALFTTEKPVIFNFHGYPRLIHEMTYRRHNHDNIHVRGYIERGSINTPMELAIRNGIDRYSLVMDVIKYTQQQGTSIDQLKALMDREKSACLQYAYTHGVDSDVVETWRWSA